MAHDLHQWLANIGAKTLYIEAPGWATGHWLIAGLPDIKPGEWEGQEKPCPSLLHL